MDGGDWNQGGEEESSSSSPHNFNNAFPSSSSAPSSRENQTNCSSTETFAASSTTTDPWLPLPSSSSAGNVSSSNKESSESSVEQWLRGIDNNQQQGDQVSSAEADAVTGSGQEDRLDALVDNFSNNDFLMPPATTSTAVGDSGGSSKNGKGQACTHLVKGVSMPGLRKALKQEITGICSKKDCVITTAKQWMCMQCGNIGCGDNNGGGGHAKIHAGTARSDCHSISVHLQGNLEKGWCFTCQLEVETSSPFFKESINFLRRQMKVKAMLSQMNSPVSSTPISLGPPPPPPVPKIDPPKTFTIKGKHNNRYVSATSSSSSYNQWDNNSRDSPLGLDNLGNTCFMNSALQCLSRTPSLIDKLDLYGSGNIVEILVSPEDPGIQVLNPNVVMAEGAEELEEVSSESDRNFFYDKFSQGGGDVDSSSSQPLGGGESSEDGSGDVSPSSTEIDSLLDAASSRSSRKSESDGSADSVEKQIWKKELEQELAKPLKLKLNISKDSMTAKLRHCFRAVTRCSNESREGVETFSSRSYYTPRGIQLAVSKHFRLGQQADSHELLRTVVDMMKKDQIRAFRVAIMARYGVKKNEGKNCDPRVAELLKMWDRRVYHKTSVDEIFGGELVTFQECMKCKNIRRSHEEFLDISLPIRVFRHNPNPTTKKTYSLFDDDYDYVINRSVEECLTAYTEPEFLTGSNAVECENCHRMNLEQLANGVPFDQVFPGLKAETQQQQQQVTNKKSKQQKKPNKKRQTRQAKMKAKHIPPGYLDESPEEQQNASLEMVEDHFKTEQTKYTEKGLEEDSKSSKSGSLDDYVVVQNASTLNQDNLRSNNIKSSNDTGEGDNNMEYDTSDACQSTLTEESPQEDLEDTFGKQDSSLSRGLSSSLKSLSLIENGMDVEENSYPPEDEDMDNNYQNQDEDMMDDIDEPAVDGIGNASDIEDDENSRPLPLDLGLEDNPISVTDYLTVPGVNGGTADEGYSEGENSSEDKPSQSISESSSHNSISEGDIALGDGDNKHAKKIPVTKCPCSRRQLISRAPECLTLHLKRFQHTARGSSKLGDKVKFPYILNLTEFCSEVGEDVTKPGFKSTFDEDGQVIYSLYGIVEHSGSLHFGHYVAYIKVAGKPTQQQTSSESPTESEDFSEDKWFYISDAHVAKTTLKQVLSQDAYILFYERIRGQEKKERLFNSIKSVEVEKDTYTNRSTYNYNYDKPATVTTAAVSSWEEDKFLDMFPCDESSNQQVSSTNDAPTEDMSITITYDADPISSTTLYSSSIPLTAPSGPTFVDGVSSSTDNTMDYSVPAGPGIGSWQLWSKDTIQTVREGMDDDEGEEETPNTNPVSSSSDVVLNPASPSSDAYTRCEEVD